jgi:hypothetical protein
LQQTLAKRSSRVSCSREVAQNLIKIFPIAKYSSQLENITEDIELKDMDSFFALIYEGSLQECREKDARRRRRRHSEAYFTARKHPLLREIINMFAMSAYSLGEAVRYGARLKVNKDIIFRVFPFSLNMSSFHRVHRAPPCQSFNSLLLICHLLIHRWRL